MINYQDYCKIHKLYFTDKLSMNVIAREMSINSKTVKYWVKKPKYVARKNRNRSGKLDCHKAIIKQLLEKHPYSAVQIEQIIKENGYTGSYSILKDYVRKIRPTPTKAYLSLSFAPAECAQVDWGSYGSVNVQNTRRKLSIFTMVLSYSRMLYLEFTLSQRMEHFLECHKNAFEFFGAVPQKIMIDNLKTGVLEHKHGQTAVFNPNYTDFANHYGFKPIACNPYSPHEKGQVENAVGYVKKNLLNGLQINDFSHLIPKAKRWNSEVANERIHGKTRQKPILLFADEKEKMTSLPVNPYDISRKESLRANSQFRIALDGNRYSVPAQYASHILDASIFANKILLYHENRLIAQHIRSYARGADIENPDHPKALLAQRRKANWQKLLQRFLQLSSKASEYYQQLQECRLNPNIHLKKIIALSDMYSREQMQVAIEDACELQAFSSEYIANILEQRNNFEQPKGILHLSHNADMLKLQTPETDLNIYEQNN